MASTSSSTEFLVEEEPERQYLQKPLFASTSSSTSKSILSGGGGSSGGGNKKLNYGSLRKETEHTATVFMVNYKHQLKSGETMQGISLRYGVPIESIKKANRLWSNDLAFVKDVLLIPMSRDRLVELGLDETQTESVNQSMLSRSSSSQVVDQSPTASLSSRASLADDSNGGSQFKDYLSKYDTVITESRQKLKTLETSSNLKNGKSYTIKNNGRHGDHNNNYDDNNDDDLFQLGKKLSLASSSQHASSSGSITPSNSASLFDTPDLVIITNNDSTSSSSRSSKASFYNGNMSSSNLSSGGAQLTSSSRARLAQENLQRLEREKDDLYEL